VVASLVYSGRVICIRDTKDECRILVVSHLGRRQLGRERRWEYNIKVYF
jgi:hypothetical protein